MARYFFHLHECGTILSDEEGSEHADLAAVERAALQAARDVMCGEIAQGRLCLSCCIDVADASGSSVMSVKFIDAVAISGL